MILPVYAARKPNYEEVFAEPADNKETMLQAVLVALLACLVWGGPFSGAPAEQGSSSGGVNGTSGTSGGGATILTRREDVVQHLEGAIDAQQVANITEEELRYHYFQSHDFDGNKALDGTEMLKAVMHSAPQEKTSSRDEAESSATVQDDEDVSAMAQFYVDVIDRVLSEGDLNKDGFLSYPEYVLVNQRAIERQLEQNALEQL